MHLELQAQRMFALIRRSFALNPHRLLFTSLDSPNSRSETIEAITKTEDPQVQSPYLNLMHSYRCPWAFKWHLLIPINVQLAIPQSDRMVATIYSFSLKRSIG